MTGRYLDQQHLARQIEDEELLRTTFLLVDADFIRFLRVVKIRSCHVVVISSVLLPLEN